MPGKRRYGSSTPLKRLRCCPEATEPSVLLLWARERTPLLNRLCLNVIREVGYYMCGAVFLPALYKDCLYVVNLHTRKHRSIPFPATKGGIPIFHPVGCNAAIYMQRVRKGYLAYWLNFTSLKFTKMSGHNLTSRKPFICYASGRIYIFREKLLIEKYPLNQHKWSTIANSRIEGFIVFAFTHLNTIYILTCSNVRLFDILSEQLTGSIQFPINVISYGVTVKLSDNRIICLHRDYYICIWDLEHNTYQRNQHHSLSNASLQGYARNIGAFVYWMDAFSPVLHSYNIDTLENEQLNL